MGNTLNGEKELKLMITLLIIVQHDKIKILFTLRGGLSQKTISRYCPFKWIVEVFISKCENLTGKYDYRWIL